MNGDAFSSPPWLNGNNARLHSYSGVPYSLIKAHREPNHCAQGEKGEVTAVRAYIGTGPCSWAFDEDLEARWPTASGRRNAKRAASKQASDWL